MNKVSISQDWLGDLDSEFGGCPESPWDYVDYQVYEYVRVLIKRNGWGYDE